MVLSISDFGVDRTYLVGEYHQSPVGLTTQYTSHTLCSMSHRIESEVVILANSVIITQELEPGFQYTTLGILVRDTKHNDRSAVVANHQHLDRLMHRGSGLTYWSKSIPSDTLPRATDSMTAPRPLLHA